MSGWGGGWVSGWMSEGVGGGLSEWGCGRVGG